MKILFLILLSSFDSEAPETIYVEDREVFSCGIEYKDGNQYLWLSKSNNNFDELAILKPGESTSHFLIVGSPPQKMKSLMEKRAFAAGSMFEFPVLEIEGLQWKSDSKSEKIFTAEGEYEFSISTSLESDAGGFTCSVKYKPSKKGKAWT